MKKVSIPHISEGWIMTRNLIAMASRTLSMVRSSSNGPRRQRTSLRLENLEGRLSLSGIQGNHIGVATVVLRKHDPVEVQPADLNPQPLPPGIFRVEPMIVGAHIGTA
jgi:hypothetical protein